MPPINLLIKPASSNCNLACKYCFYHDVSENRDIISYGMMNIEQLESIVKKTMDFAEHQCTFAFQGGEPTLVGLDFYKALIKFEKKYAKPGLQVHNAIQTNGIHMNEEWAKFLARNKFLVGLSMDGTKEVNDSLRVDRKGEGTYERIMQTAALFDEYKVEYNILTVVTKPLAKNIKSVYKDYMKNGMPYMQFIPCLDEIGEKRGHKDYSLTPDVYEKFLKDLFDMWYGTLKSGGFSYERYFENLIQKLVGYYPEACGAMGVCTTQYVVEADGGVYPCDFYVMDDYKIGNILEDDFEQIEKNRANIAFIEESIPKDSGCRKCKWHNLCRGGCKRDRHDFETGKVGRSYFCSAYKGFFKYAYPRLNEIATEIKKNSTR